MFSLSTGILKMELAYLSLNWFQNVSEQVVIDKYPNLISDNFFSFLTILFSTVADVISQFVMLYMMLSLSLGWTLAVAYKYHHSTLVQLKEKPAAKIVAVIGVLQVVYFTSIFN